MSVDLSLRFRRNFGTDLSCVKQLPKMIDFLFESYERFLQEKEPNNRKKTGLELIFSSVFPIESIKTGLKIEYVRYEVGEPAFSEEECKDKSYTYSVPLCLFLNVSNEKSGIQSVEKKIYLGELPQMCDRGCFLVNGVYRAVVSQLKKSPGVLFCEERGKNIRENSVFAKIMPNYGSWIQFLFDFHSLLFFRIDNKKKILVTTLLLALGKDEDKINEKGNYVIDPGYTKEEILKMFYSYDTCKLEKSDQDGNLWSCPFTSQYFANIIFKKDILDAKTNQVIINAGEALSSGDWKKQSAKRVLVHETDLPMVIVAQDIIEENGVVLIEAGHQVVSKIWKQINTKKINTFEVLVLDLSKENMSICNTLVADKNLDRKEALITIARALKLTDQTTIPVINEYIKNLFFDSKNFDFSTLGRNNINRKLGINVNQNILHLTKEDIIATIKKLLNVKMGIEPCDDIDSMINKRISSVGDLMYDQCFIGAKKMAKSAKERLSSYDVNLELSDIISGRLFFFRLKKMINVSNLSQFLDEYNPLSTGSHLRRVSSYSMKISDGTPAKGSKHRNDEARNVHETEIGKICGISTSEGQAIGMIKYLAMFTKISEQGVICTPYFAVKNCIIDRSKIIYLDINKELENVCITTEYVDKTNDKKWVIKEGTLKCRKFGVFSTCTAKEVTYINIIPLQSLSASASLIPFLENNDAFRCLVAQNMQRQAVPLIRKEAPIVGTGMERIIAQDLIGVTIVSKVDGVVKKVDGERICIVADVIDEDRLQDLVTIYNLKSFYRTNQNTVINHRSIVKVGDRVIKGQIIADSNSTTYGELSLGVNAIVVINAGPAVYEDSVSISQKFAYEMDKLTSVYVSEFEVTTKDTKLGEEIFSSEVEDHNKILDEQGLAREGAFVRTGNKIVGKIAPENLSTVSPYKRFLYFAFKKTGTRDCSFMVPEGVKGYVHKVDIIRRSGVIADERLMMNEVKKIKTLESELNEKINLLKENVNSYLQSIKEDNIKKDYSEIIKKLKDSTDSQIKKWTKETEDSIINITRGSDLPPGVLKLAKIQVMELRKIAIGDKVCGFHGDKGVVQKIMPTEDMPFLENGVPADFVLNILSFPARMNIGQLKETILGMACYLIGEKIKKKLDNLIEKKISFDELADLIQRVTKVDIRTLEGATLDNFVLNLTKGLYVACPPFEGIAENELDDLLDAAGLKKGEGLKVYDGKTGELLNDNVVVGKKYILKLHHTAVDKLHARSTGPYTQIYNQPVAGRSHGGGQRVGQMEIWATFAHGAAYNTKDCVSIKSDDQRGKIHLYNTIVSGENMVKYGMPVSTEVFVAMIKSLGIDVVINLSGNQTFGDKKSKRVHNTSIKDFEQFPFENVFGEI